MSVMDHSVYARARMQEIELENALQAQIYGTLPIPHVISLH
jgi:hypothetical protein